MLGTILVNLLLLLLVLYVVKLVVPVLGLPEPANQIAYLIVGVAGLLYMLRLFGVLV